jgi:hypothetical protein
VVGGAIVVAVAARLPLLHLPAWADESGFLTVGGGWHLGGSAVHGGLYGQYWVDRPPVLVTVYGIAERLGGLVPLRLMGALAVAATIAGVAWIARTAAGDRAARWGAVASAALLCTPFHWSFLVDGELLAAPMVALGIALAGSGPLTDGRRGLVRSGLAGVLGVAAILTKQNIADVFVFMAAYLLIRALSRSAPFWTLVRHGIAFTVGILGSGALAAAWTIAHGTTLGAVYYAMYPFRYDAADGFSWARLAQLGVAATLSGLTLLALWVVFSGVRRSNRDAWVGALLVVLVFDLYSIAAGGNFWLHYLIQPVVPVAALAGILVARGSWLRVVVVLSVPLALASWVMLLTAPPQTAEELVGQAIGRVAHPGDSIVTVMGRANVNYAAGLSSPYPYLWEVPAATLDPGGAKLARLLESDRAPVWVVAWNKVHTGHEPGPVGRAIGLDYRPAARICGHDVYVRLDVRRREPVPHPRADATARSECKSVTVLPRLIRKLS